MHPYTKTGATDNYYCRLVNRIIDVLYDYDIMEGEIEPEDEIYEDTAIFLVGWFEDIISQTGVWQVFTSQCENGMAADCLSMNRAKIIIQTR